MSGPASVVSCDCAVQPWLFQYQSFPSASYSYRSFPGAPLSSPSAALQQTLATCGSESQVGFGRPAAEWQSETESEEMVTGKKGQAVWWSLVSVWNQTYSVIWFEVQHKLLQCCFIVLYRHCVQHFSWFFLSLPHPPSFCCRSSCCCKSGPGSRRASPSWTGFAVLTLPFSLSPLLWFQSLPKKMTLVSG